MKYFSEHNLPPVIPSEPGEEKVPHYRLDPIKNEVIQDGEDDFQTLIQASKDSCDVHRVLARYKQTQDETLLKIRSTLEGFDQTNFPGSTLEAQMRLRELSEIYENDPRLRKAFSSFADFARNGLDPTRYGDFVGDKTIKIGGVEYVPKTQVDQISPANQNDSPAAS